jgi:hypothetical protein
MRDSYPHVKCVDCGGVFYPDSSDGKLKEAPIEIATMYKLSGIHLPADRCEACSAGMWKKAHKNINQLTVARLRASYLVSPRINSPQKWGQLNSRSRPNSAGTITE